LKRNEGLQILHSGEDCKSFTAGVSKKDSLSVRKINESAAHRNVLLKKHTELTKLQRSDILTAYLFGF
jgi:hypothetical protein